MLRIAERTASVEGLNPAVRELIASQVIPLRWYDFAVAEAIILAAHAKLFWRPG